MQNSNKKTIIYCRESRDDYGENYERIETQRDLLIKYCKSKGYTNIVDVIMDDDKSGTDFTRFDDIKKRAKNKEIDAIVFKNSARLGRNQREALAFVEYLEENGTEIIFEDEQYNEEMFGLYAWFNERRARDDSKNIRRNLRHKIEEGTLLIKAIYGYNKCGKKLEINSETAPTVKKIYELYSQGWGYKKIATYLNLKGIPTPSQSRNFANAKQAQNWKSQHISRILQDRRYVGDYVGGRTEKLSFKSKKTRLKPQEEWTIIKNNHEPIIDVVLFDRVQKLREERKIECLEKNKCKGFQLKNNGCGNIPSENIKYKNIQLAISNSRYTDYENNKFSGILYCGRCGAFMYKRKGSYGKTKRPDSYICKKYSLEGAIKIHKEEHTNIANYSANYGCKSHRIRIEHLEKIVNNYVVNMLKDPKLVKYTMDMLNGNKSNLEDELSNSRKLLEKYKKQYSQIYDDKLNCLIPLTLYTEKKQELDKKIEAENKKIKNVEQILELISHEDYEKRLVSKTINDINNNGLKREVLLQLFDKIIVFEPQEITSAQKSLYNLTEETFNQIFQNGGVLCILKKPPANVTHKITT